jgi:hypothetical protein
MMPMFFRFSGVRHGGRFLLVEHGHVVYGLRHRPMTKIARLAASARRYPRKGRALC